MRSMVCRNRLVERGLGKTRFIGFIVSKSAVTQNINEYIVMKLLHVFHCHLDRMHQRFGIVPVHMKYRRKSHLRNISTIRTGTAITEVGGKTNLLKIGKT